LLFVVELIQLLLLLFIVLLSIFLGIYLTYFFYLWKFAKVPWRLNIEKNFWPKVSVLVPVHNEERIIESKLENIKGVVYPREKMEVFVVDDASEDKTLEKVRCFMENNSDFKLHIVEQNPHLGKSTALNRALEFCNGDVIVVSDADTSWPSDILLKALPYLSDPCVGAVTGRGVNRNTFESWVTRGENIYLRLTSLLRLGESKIHSTIKFEGGFCAYKRGAFKKFDCETGSDDSGTALEVVQNGFRAIMVPEAVFYTDFPTKIRDKFKIKVRRANQLISLWAKCFKLMLKRKLRLPKRIAVPEIMLFVFSPIILIALIATVLVTLALFPLSPFSITIMLSIVSLLVFVRHAFLELLLDNLILFYALITFLLGRRFIAWEKPR
jgi:cellulose synthase/poly-beta-1,6-N-acetylglucosamine synthase-like glycosyltransferase